MVGTVHLFKQRPTRSYVVAEFVIWKFTMFIAVDITSLRPEFEFSDKGFPDG